MYKVDNKIGDKNVNTIPVNTIPMINHKKHTDEFHKLRNLALELKNLQLQVIKDLNKK